MTYRPIGEEEIPIVADIQARAFREKVDRYMERYHRGGRVDWRHVRLLESEQGEPVAALVVLERAMSLNGGEVTASLVSGVAVPPDQRRRGYARSLMIGLLEELYQKQLSVSLLFPFSVAYYRRLGYALVNMNWLLDIPPHHLPHYPERVAVRRARPEDHDAICVCYERARQHPQNNGWLARTDWEWQNRVWRDEREGVVCPASGEVEGYLIYEWSWSAADRPVKVVEWVATSDAAWRGLAGFLASLRDQASSITFNAPQDSPLLLALNEPYSAVEGVTEFVYRQAARLISGFTLRVIHLPSALRARRYPVGLKLELLLRVDDPQLPGNSHPLHVHIAEGAASVALAHGLFPDGPPTSVETDIATFSQLYAGFLSAEQARVIGRLHADDATCAGVTAAFAAAPFYLHRSDWF